MYNLKILREQAGFNMREVARQLNIPYTTYVGYEKGDREPNSETLIKIAEFYDTTVDYILGVPRSYKAIHENSCSKTDIFKQIQENYGPSTKEAISIYIQLDTEDKAEIRGEMKQMLKAPKYNERVTPKPQVHVPNASIGKIAAFGSGPADIEIDEESKKKLAQLARKKQK